MDYDIMPIERARALGIVEPPVKAKTVDQHPSLATALHPQASLVDQWLAARQGEAVSIIEEDVSIEQFRKMGFI